MIVVDEGEYVLGIWVVDGPRSNCLTIIKRKPNERWSIDSRIRWIVDTKLFEESADPRECYRWSATPDATDDDMIAMGREVSLLAKQLLLGSVIHEAIVQSTDPEAFHMALSTFPGMHSQTRWTH